MVGFFSRSFLTVGCGVVVAAAVVLIAVLALNRRQEHD